MPMSSEDADDDHDDQKLDEDEASLVAADLLHLPQLPGRPVQHTPSSLLFPPACSTTVRLTFLRRGHPSAEHSGRMPSSRVPVILAFRVTMRIHAKRGKSSQRKGAPYGAPKLSVAR
jgi:hypothetical protein